MFRLVLRWATVVVDFESARRGFDRGRGYGRGCSARQSAHPYRPLLHPRAERIPCALFRRRSARAALIRVPARPAVAAGACSRLRKTARRKPANAPSAHALSDNAMPINAIITPSIQFMARPAASRRPLLSVPPRSPRSANMARTDINPAKR